ncbi:GLN1, partial [Symbiodinium microadriaticum]
MFREWNELGVCGALQLVERTMDGRSSWFEVIRFGDDTPHRAGGRANCTPFILTDESLLRRNSAFFYFKPGANNPSVIEFVRDWLVSSGFLITEEGSIAATVIEKGCLVDKMFANIGKKAYVKKPSELTLPAPAFIRFQKKFGMSWSSAIFEGVVYNAADALTALGINPEQLNDAWNRAMEKGLVVKFERGFYCGLLDTIPDKGSIFCVNGFFMQMRAKYLTSTIHYFNIEWEQNLMNWEHFRRTVIGSSNIKNSHNKSLRSVLNSEWKSLGIVSPPNMQDNCIHGSASAFEAFVERTIWLHVPFDSDPFAKKLMASGLTPQCLREWAINPLVAGKKLFQHFENLGTEDCLDKALDLYSTSTGIPRSSLGSVAAGPAPSIDNNNPGTYGSTTALSPDVTYSINAACKGAIRNSSYIGKKIKYKLETTITSFLLTMTLFPVAWRIPTATVTWPRKHAPLSGRVVHVITGSTAVPSHIMRWKAEIGTTSARGDLENGHVVPDLRRICGGM